MDPDFSELKLLYQSEEPERGAKPMPVKSPWWKCWDTPPAVASVTTLVHGPYKDRDTHLHPPHSSRSMEQVLADPPGRQQQEEEFRRQQQELHNLFRLQQRELHNLRWFQERQLQDLCRLHQQDLQKLSWR